MRILLITILLVLPRLVNSQPELSGDPHDLRDFLRQVDNVVSISGEAELKAYSDKAIISLLVTTKAKKLAQAITDNAALRVSVFEQLTKLGIAAQNIKNSKFSSAPQYGWFGEKPASFEVNNRMAIQISKELHLSSIAKLTDEHEEIEIADISFEHSQKDEFKQKVLLNALNKVLEEKKIYEQSLNIKLRSIGFRDSHVSLMATRGATLRQQHEQIPLQENPITDVIRIPERKLAPAQPSFDEIRYQANIMVDFEIVPPN